MQAIAKLKKFLIVPLHAEPSLYDSNTRGNEQMTKAKFYEIDRRKLLTLVCNARKEKYRLLSEIAAISDTVPQGSYIGTYLSHSSTYKTLGNKDPVFPSRKDADKLIKKLHLGISANPNLLDAALGIEAMRTKQIKDDTLIVVNEHLEDLKNFWKILEQRDTKPYETHKDLIEHRLRRKKTSTGNYIITGYFSVGYDFLKIPA